MKPGTVYIENEGRQFGLESRVRVRRQKGAAPTGEDDILHEIDAPFIFLPELRCRIWALTHGYGWLGRVVE